MATPPCRVYLKIPLHTPKSQNCFNSVENDINLLFNIEEIADILASTNKATSKVLSGLTMLGAPEYPKIDTKIMNSLTIEKWRLSYIIPTMQCLW